RERYSSLGRPCGFRLSRVARAGAAPAGTDMKQQAKGRQSPSAGLDQSLLCQKRPKSHFRAMDRRRFLGKSRKLPVFDRMRNDRAFRFSVAPMMEWTDSFCRLFHRAMTREARLYPEMVTAAALIQGPRRSLLAFEPQEQPLALQ